MKALRKLTYRGCAYFFDEKMSELRDIHHPWKRIPLKDWEVLWIKNTGQCPGDLSSGGVRSPRRRTPHHRNTYKDACPEWTLR